MRDISFGEHEAATALHETGTGCYHLRNILRETIFVERNLVAPQVNNQSRLTQLCRGEALHKHMGRVGQPGQA